MGLYALCLLTVTFQVVFSSSAVHPDVLKEGHAILKRFADAEQEYTSHQIADVLYKKESNSFHRISKRDLKSVTEDENVKSIRLDLSSGLSLHLNLKKRSLFNSDTQFFYHTDRGHVKIQTPPQDCYATGHVEVDGKNGGTVVVALCDGLHGTATSNGVEYYFYPVETIQGEHKVHVLSRPSSQNDMVNEKGIDELYDPVEIYKRQKRGTVTADTYNTANGFVIELAIFVDSHYDKLLRAMVRDKKDEFVLMTLAAVQTRYIHENYVGYQVRFKIKLLMTWHDDPNEYQFSQSVHESLLEFKNYTESRYEYDIHFLLTGVTEGGQPYSESYERGACTINRMAAMRSTDNSRINEMARAIGHLLGLKLRGPSKPFSCPKSVDVHGEGFMGSGDKFTLCNKRELENYFKGGNGLCLFEETAKTEMPEESVLVPNVFPGQYQSPDKQCRMFAGKGYIYYNPFDSFGRAVCALWMCINLNKGSPHYLRVVKSRALRGYPCGQDLFCFDSDCRSRWYLPMNWWYTKTLQEYSKTVTWGKWTKKWSKCTRRCGSGVHFKRRRCIIPKGTNVTPYCRGKSVKAKLCNKNPCRDNRTSKKEEIRKARGDNVCARFHNNKVPLELKTEQSKYLNKSIDFKMENDLSLYFKTSKGCMLTCQRVPHEDNKLDGILPDGTPCSDMPQSVIYYTGGGYQLRCVQGECMWIR